MLYRMVVIMPRNKKYFIKVYLEEPEYKFICDMTNEKDLSKSEAIRRIIVSFNVLTSTPLWKLLKPLDFGKEQE